MIVNYKILGILLFIYLHLQNVNRILKLVYFNVIRKLKTSRLVISMRPRRVVAYINSSMVYTFTAILSHPCKLLGNVPPTSPPSTRKKEG